MPPSRQPSAQGHHPLRWFATGIAFFSSMTPDSINYSPSKRRRLFTGTPGGKNNTLTLNFPEGKCFRYISHLISAKFCSHASRVRQTQDVGVEHLIMTCPDADDLVLRKSRIPLLVGSHGHLVDRDDNSDTAQSQRKQFEETVLPGLRKWLALFAWLN